MVNSTAPSDYSAKRGHFLLHPWN